MIMALLTPLEIKNIPNRKTRTEPLGHGNGTMVFWRERGRVQCYYRYYTGNKPTLIHIGPYKETGAGTGYTLPECRLKANDLVKTKREIGNQDLKAYLDVEAVKSEAALKEATREAEIAASRGTLSDLLDSYLMQMERDGKVSVAEARRSFQANIHQPLPHLASKIARNVTPDDIVDILAPIVERGARIQANRVRSYLHAAFSHGAHADYDPARRGKRRFRLSSNPVSLIKKDHSAENAKDRILSDDELRDFYLEVGKTNKVGIVMMLLVQLMVATAGQRPQPLIRTLWKDYDFKRRTLTLLERKGKGKPRKHVVPLTARAIRIMRLVKGHNGDLPGPFYSSEGKEFRLDSLKNVFIRWHGDRLEKARLHGLSEPERFTARDIRRTANYLLTDAGVRPEDSNLLQSHGQTGIVKKHYDRHDHLSTKRKAIRKYDRELSRLLTGRN